MMLAFAGSQIPDPKQVLRLVSGHHAERHNDVDSSQQFSGNG